MWFLHYSLQGMILMQPLVCRLASLMEWQQMETEENRKLRIHELPMQENTTSPFALFITEPTRSMLGPTTSFNLSVFRLMRSLPLGFLDMLDKLTHCNTERWFVLLP